MAVDVVLRKAKDFIKKGIIPKECSTIYSFMSWGDIYSIDVSFKSFAASMKDGPYLDVLLG